jgi:hypothetical protein
MYKIIKYFNKDIKECASMKGDINENIFNSTLKSYGINQT